jgi:hypothetical protein
MRDRRSSVNGELPSRFRLLLIIFLVHLQVRCMPIPYYWVFLVTVACGGGYTLYDSKYIYDLYTC